MRSIFCRFTNELALLGASPKVPYPPLQNLERFDKLVGPKYIDIVISSGLTSLHFTVQGGKFLGLANILTIATIATSSPTISTIATFA